MKCIDIHTHIYPDQIAEKAVASVREFYGVGDGLMDGTVKMLLDRGRQAGAEKFVILPVAIRPDRVRHINAYIQEQAEEHECLIPFGTVHAAMEALTDEVEQLLESGIKGIKIHPDFQQFPIDDERLFPLYDMVRGKVPVMMHMGDPRYDFSHPARLRKVLDMFPHLMVIAAHFGGYTMYDTAQELLKDTDCILDVSSSMRFMESGMPERYINAYGAERIAYGTDYPIWDPVREMEFFMNLKITDEQREQILWKTAHRVLKL